MRLIVLFLIAVSAQAQITLQGQNIGSLVDYYNAHSDITGDTNYTWLGPVTYADGTSGGTSVINRNDGTGNHTINGTIFVTANDGSDQSANSRNLFIYKLTTLDMTSAANTTAGAVNDMAGYGTGGATNTPTGWNGQSTSGQGSGYSWKSGPLFGFSGWVCMPILRQSGPGNYNGGDSSVVCSPDGGAYWMNPNSYKKNTVSNVACSSGTVTLTTNTNALTGGGGQVIWVHDANTGANGKFTTTAATSTTVSYAKTCAGITTGGSSGFVGLMSATGDAPLDPSTASYTGTPSSMLFKDLTPYDGSTNKAGRMLFFYYCQGNECTGSPDGADSYLNGFTSLGNQTAYYNVRIPKNINSVMDSTAWEFYACSGYLPGNVCDGTSATYRSTTLSNATMIFSGDGGIANGGGTSINPLPNGFTDQHGQMFGNPTYYTANGGSAYIATTYIDYLQNGYGRSNIMAFPTPWGPFTQTTSEFPNPIAGFWTLVPFMMHTTDSKPYHAVFAGIGDNGAHSLQFTVFFQQYELYLGGQQNGMSVAGCTPYRFTWSPVAGSIIRNGLWAYFDFYSHGCGLTQTGNIYYDSMFAKDLTTYPTQKQVVGCFTDGVDKCANTNSGKNLEYSTDGWVVGNTGYQSRGEIADTVPGTYNRVTSTPFNSSADPAWTTGIVLKNGDISGTASQATIMTGPSNHQMVVLVSLGTAGKVGVRWEIAAGATVDANTSSAVISNGTWYYVTISKSPGAVTVCGTVPCALSSATVHIYIDGVEVAVTRTNTGTPDMQTGKVMVGAGTASYNGSTSFYGGWEIYSRVLTPDEIVHNYNTHKLRLTTRGISFAASGTPSWTGLSNGQWTGLTNGQWTAMTN